VVGSDHAEIKRAIADTQKTAMTVPVTMEARGDLLTIRVEDISGGPAGGEIWLSAVTKAVPVVVDRGENVGRALTYYNVGRRWVKIGEWNGRAASWTWPLSDLRADGMDAAAVIIQSGSSENPGPILGAAFADFP